MATNIIYKVLQKVFHKLLGEEGNINKKHFHIGNYIFNPLINNKYRAPHSNINEDFPLQLQC